MAPTAAGSLGSHGPGSSDDNRNTRRRLDTFSGPEDEQARSAVLLRFPCEQYHKMPADNRPVTIHCKAGSTSVRLALLSDIKRMASSMRLTVPVGASKQLLLSANPNPLKTGRLKDNLHLCGENWLTSLKFSSLIEMTKVHSSSQRSTLARMSSASKIEEMELENRCSNLLLLEAGKHLPLFNLSCLSLLFLLMCCNVFSLKPTRPMCDGRPLASLLFRRLAGRGAFLCGFPFRWVPHFVLSLTRSVPLHDSTSCSREDSLDECERPCDTLFCLLFSAPWLRCNYSILVQETQSAKDLDLTCFTTFPFVADCVSFTRTGLLIPVGWALFWVTSTSVIRKKDD